MKAVLDEASKHIGLKEIPGAKHNPTIVQMFADVGHEWVKDDETAWCAAFVGAILKRVGLPHTGKLNARSYLLWGDAVKPALAEPGDVMIFSRGDPNGWQGHVAFFVRPAEGGYMVCGGNQSNAVTVAFYPKNRLLGVRRMKMPEPVIPVVTAPATFFARFVGWLQSFRKGGRT
jgi:uncharacterized protein (TIGR02594 family)